MRQTDGAVRCSDDLLAVEDANDHGQDKDEHGRLQEPSAFGPPGVRHHKSSLVTQPVARSLTSPPGGEGLQWPSARPAR
jgi:hypothetical protein